MKKILFLLLVALLASCSDDDDIQRSAEKQMLEFSINETKATIDQASHTVTMELPSGTDVSSLKPVIVVSDKASVDPLSGTEQNFTQPVNYTVTAEDGSKQVYAITITTAKSSHKDVLSFVVPGENKNIAADIDHETMIISMVVPAGMDITKLAPVINISQGAVISPASEEQQDFSYPVVYTVTAQDGSKQEYTAVLKDEVDNAAPRLISTIIDRESGVKPYHRFQYDNSDRLVYYIETEPAMLDEVVDKDIVEIVYGSGAKVEKIIKTENAGQAGEIKHILKVTYHENSTIHVTEEPETSASDIITLNAEGKVVGFETNNEKQIFEYDKAGNLTKLTAGDGSYQVIAYDDKNGLFRYGNTPQWIWLYATGQLIGKGPNNFTSSQSYTADGKLTETISYKYSYNNLSWYPNAYKNEKHRHWVCMFYTSM